MQEQSQQVGRALESQSLWMISTVSMLAGCLLWYGFQSNVLTYDFSPDGQIYVDTARNVLSGEGIARSSTPWNYPAEVVPLKHLAPLYPLMLAVGAAVWDCDPRAVAMPLSSLLLALNVWLIGWLVLRISGSGWGALLAMVLLATSRPMYQIHKSALSEPVFMVLFLVALICVLRYTERRYYSDLLCCAIATGLAAVVRYQALFLLPTIAVVVVWGSLGTWKQRLSRGTVFGVITVMPFALWFVRTKWVYPEGAIRSLSVHWVDYGALWTLFNTTANWFTYRFVPMKLKLVIVFVVGVLLLYSAYRIIRQNNSQAYKSWFGIAAFVVAVQMVFLMIVRCFFDAGMPFDHRILSSIHVVVLMTACATISRLSRLVASRAIMGVAALFALMFVSANSYHTYRMASHDWHKVRRAQARAFPFDTAPEWRENSGPVYSNYATKLYWGFDKPTKYLPPKHDDAALQAFVDQVKQQRGVVVVYHNAPNRAYLVGLEELESHPGLKRIPVSDEISLFRSAEQ